MYMYLTTKKKKKKPSLGVFSIEPETLLRFPITQVSQCSNRALEAPRQAFSPPRSLVLPQPRRPCPLANLGLPLHLETRFLLCVALPASSLIQRAVPAFLCVLVSP